MARPRKTLAQQQSRRTTEVQEELKATEEKLNELTPLQNEPPEHLDDLAKEEYYRITELLVELPIASLDLSLVSTYCQTYSNYIKATEQIKTHGLVVETERGTKLSSYYTVQRDCTDRLISLSNKLGLSIDSRMRIMTPKNDVKEDDPFGDMLNNG